MPISDFCLCLSFIGSSLSTFSISIIFISGSSAFSALSAVSMPRFVHTFVRVCLPLLLCLLCLYPGFVYFAHTWVSPLLLLRLLYFYLGFVRYAYAWVCWLFPLRLLCLYPGLLLFLLCLLYMCLGFVRYTCIWVYLLFPLHLLCCCLNVLSFCYICYACA